MTPIDPKYKIIEFESLGTNIKNTKRFMAVNPTAGGYEFEWEEVLDESKKHKPMFKCVTPKGLILSGKKSEMTFEYTPDSVGEHESKWIFRIPSEDITQHFLIVGRVNEPNVLLETGKIKFGPLLLQGKNKEVVKIVNQEHIPFAFSFARESIRGSPDYGEGALRVVPSSGVVPALSDLPIEIHFQPKHEVKYNYNLTCNVKRKARPLILNVKGEGYKIHHTVFADEPRREAKAGEPFNLDFGEFFINEKKSKTVVLTNSGDFNFDFVWKRQVNKYIKITPETGTVTKGGEVEIQIDYAPISEHQLKNFKMMLTIVSGPKYDFVLQGKARKPGVKLNSHVFDFGPCFVTPQPAPIKKILEITNLDA
jgi:hydrocephalus-inducing protein